MDQDARKAEIARRLDETRAVTLRLLERVPEAAWNVRVHDFYSPVGWHFGHVGMTEEFWTWHRALGRPPGDERLYFLFANLPQNTKDNRAAHLPSRAEVVAYLEATRRRTLEALVAADLSSPDRLLTCGYAWEFARLHECQHQETVAELLQLIQGALSSGGSGALSSGGSGALSPGGSGALSPGGSGALSPGPSPPLSLRDGRGEEEGEAIGGAPERRVTGTPLPSRSDNGGEGPGERAPTHRLPGGTFRMGSDDPLLSYDNERPAHEVKVAPFLLEREPVSAGDWLAFLADGGYRRPELWHPDGWAWRCETGAEMPEYWRRLTDGTFGYVSDRGLVPLDHTKPANALSWYEADAYARWAGKRLPTEAEWEYAAGVLGLGGGVWEWTTSPFLPYPGFEAFPYDGYSKEHMDGKHYVCKGGSWATAADIARPAFRNWYVPTYRQGFLGLRCAADD